MIELTMTIDDIDYASVIAALSGRSGALAAAGKAASLLPDAKKTELALHYINSNPDKLARALEGMAEKKGVRMHIGTIHADVK